jgi:hypothetical protein
MLRPAWEQAYRHGRSFYEFNGDRYMTMYKGKPFVPQVCADFIIDTIDRTASTWYRSSLKAPHKTLGRYNMRTSMEVVGLVPRRVNDVLEFFERNPTQFQMLFKGRGPVTSQTKELKVWMKSLNVQLGDIIIFRGRAPWDHGLEEHWHSLFVTQLDVEGYVEKVTGNSIYPVERTLRIEGNRAPKRHVTNIIRITDVFLGQITGLIDPL